MNEAGLHESMIADVVIVGAGPAGCSAALALGGSGKRVLLLDKAAFPRNKTCGDSVPAHALIGLENISPGLYDSFLQTVASQSFRSSALVFPSGERFRFNWPLPGYVLERTAFDGFLLDRVVATTDVQVITGLKAVDYRRDSNQVQIDTVDNTGSPGPIISTTLVIAADGAPSLAARKLAGILPDPARFGQAVRCYFEGVGDTDPGMELIFYHPRFFPGYFWIFPMAGGRANVGFGMLESFRRKSGRPLTDLFTDFREQHKAVRSILQSARQVSPLQGGMVPFAMRKQSWSGPGYLLTGDAASLVDPVSGDGIMQAVRSGLMAGLAVRNGEEALYGGQVEKFLWNRMKSPRRAIRIASAFPFLMSGASLLGRSPRLRRAIQRWIW